MSDLYLEFDIVIIFTTHITIFDYKVQTFRETHKNLRNLPHALDVYKVNVQSMRKIFLNFVCFSESTKFKRSQIIANQGVLKFGLSKKHTKFEKTFLMLRTLTK